MCDFKSFLVLIQGTFYRSFMEIMKDDFLFCYCNYVIMYGTPFGALHMVMQFVSINGVKVTTDIKENEGY